MSDIVKLQIKIEGSDSFKEVEVSAKDLAEAIDKVKKHTHDLNEKLLNVNQIAQTIDQVSSMMRGLQSVMHDLTDTYAVQAAAEARLEQMMRNTMDATDDEIQSIKDLAAEQQKLGVIGDEVILSGAQELATYMQKKESLEALIPVMDDMIAQQYGFNASAESAVSVAQMMGKVFAGEVGALKRLGYTFDEAQEQILKFGTEEEKVATLTEVVGQIVDGTNAKLAATPYGKIAQFRNDLGDIKERLGEMVAPAMNAVDRISSLTIALAGLIKGATYVKAATAALKGFSASAAIAATRTAVLGVHSKVTATAQNMLAAAGIKAAAGTTALKIAVTGLYAAMSLGLTLAIQAVITLITRLIGKSREAADGMDAMKEANEAYKSAVSNTKAEIDAEVAALKSLMDQGKDTKEAIQNLNEKYGEAFGYHKTASEWYDTLTNKSLIYCKQLGYEAKAKSLSASIGAKIVERDELQKQYDEALKREKANKSGITLGINASKRMSIGVKISNLDEEIRVMTEEMNTAFGEASNAADQLKTIIESGAEAASWQTMTYKDLGKAIQEQTEKVKNLIAANDGTAKAEAATLQAMQKRYDDIGKQFDKLTGKVKNLGHTMQETIPQLTPISTPASIAAPTPTYTRPQALKGLFDFQNLAEFEQRLTELENLRKQASQGQLPIIDAQIALVKQLKDEFEGVNQTVARMTASEAFTKGWGGLKGIGNSIRDIKSALTETDNAWDALTQTVDGFISLFQSMQQIVEIINTITQATQTMQTARNAATQQELANAGTEVAANTAKAGSGAASAMASIPYVGPVLAIAAMASVIAALASLPKFANGGLVYGPTVGLMGEYSGASNNPEVIAPLNKLRSLLGDDSGGGSSVVEFHIKGRELVGILNKQNNIYKRSE